jgi:hypothetical protein
MFYQQTSKPKKALTPSRRITIMSERVVEHEEDENEFLLVSRAFKYREQR